MNVLAACDKLRDGAPPAKAAGAALRSDCVYYRAHKIGKLRQQPLGDGEAKYLGRLTAKAFCLDVRIFPADDSSPSNDAEDDGRVEALSGHVISFSCHRKPKAPELYAMTGQHRGSRGLLRDRVVCIIEARLTFIGRGVRREAQQGAASSDRGPVRGERRRHPLSRQSGKGRDAPWPRPRLPLPLSPPRRASPTPTLAFPCWRSSGRCPGRCWSSSSLWRP